MVACLDLLQPFEVLLQVLGIKKRGAVDALQLLVLLVTEPVGAGKRRELEAFDPAGARHMRPAAKVHKAAVPV